jgi:hypothetical protein
MSTVDQTTLTNIIIIMLERTAMVLAEPASEDNATPPQARFACIKYRGPSEGALVLAATDGFLRELAGGLLGVEPAEVDLDRFGSDALKEMANIVGGSVILALSGEVCEYSLGLPEISQTQQTFPGVNQAPGTRCAVVAEGGPLWVTWHDTTAKAAA